METMWLQLWAQSGSNAAEEKFAKIDRDNDDVLSREEFTSYCKGMWVWLCVSGLVCGNIVVFGVCIYVCLCVPQCLAGVLWQSGGAWVMWCVGVYVCLCE
jgi:hypothetical protein